MFSDPVKNIKTLELRENDIVADLGAGMGYYALPLGEMVPEGKVYAVELDKNYLDAIGQKLHERGLKNVEIIWGNVEKPGGTKIMDAIVDKAIVSNIFFQLERKDVFLKELQRILRPEGMVLLIDWNEKSIMKRKAVPKDEALVMFQKCGFSLLRQIDAGVQHYGMIFKKGTKA